MSKARSGNVRSDNAPCPACSEFLVGNLSELRKHYHKKHRRMPSDAEIYRFRVYHKDDPKFRTRAMLSEYKSNPHEVSGGLPSLGMSK